MELDQIMECSYEALRDWVYDNYEAAYCLGTGALTLGAWLMDSKRNERKAAYVSGYMGILALGALLEPCVNVTSSLYGDVLSHGSRSSKKVALTFDDGPHRHNTPEVLKVLEEEGVKASFFCVGQNAFDYPWLIKDIQKAGHLVGSHSFIHRNFLACTPRKAEEEILEGSLVLEAILNDKIRYYRPPYGTRYPWNIKYGESLRMRAVLWSNSPRDWQRPGAGIIAERVINSAKPGDIVLLHDGGGDRSQTVKALPTIIGNLRSRGFEFVRVDEL